MTGDEMVIVRCGTVRSMTEPPRSSLALRTPILVGSESDAIIQDVCVDLYGYDVCRLAEDRVRVTLEFYTPDNEDES